MTAHQSQVAIVDFGLGNLFSVRQACAQVGLDAVLVTGAAELRAADGILLPGVGAFGNAMATLQRLELVQPLRELAGAGVPLFGICLGLQLLMSESREFGCHAGLDLIPGTVARFDSPVGPRGPLKVPQVGWNRIARGANAPADPWADTPLAGLADGVYMYFVHSFHAQPVDPRAVLCRTRYGQIEFASGIRRGNVFGFQFHPERSGTAGLQIYRNIATFLGQHRKGAGHE